MKNSEAFLENARKRDLIVEERTISAAALLGEPLSASISEKDFQRLVITEANRLGWMVFHPFDSRKSEAGYPDITLVRDRVVWMELKADAGRLSAAQETWGEAISFARGEWYCFRPRDWQTILEVLR